MDFVEILRAVFALLVTLGLVLLAGWGMRRFGPDAMARLQMPRKERRLTLVETLVLDPARRLVLVRLDDEEGGGEAADFEHILLLKRACEVPLH